MVANVGQTQAPVTNAFQSGIGNNDRIGTAEQAPKTNEIQPREAPTSETQRSEEQSLARKNEESTSSSGNEEEIFASSERGSIVDIEV